MKERIEELKKELQELADRRFMLDMKDRWTSEDYERNDEMFNRIKEIIEELKQLGIETNYRHGYEIEYKEIGGAK